MWKISDEEARKAQIEFEKAKFVIDLTDEDGRDRILKIANLFGKAYRCYTTPIIPSGRPNSIISNKTYREYIYIGKGTAGVPNKDSGPGYGPWASRIVFNKFSDEISKFIEVHKYKMIFNKGSIKKTNGETMKGNVLLEFIRDMIDETKLQSYDKNRSTLLTKYFGLESKELPQATPDGKNIPVNPDDIENKVIWKDISPINKNTNNTVGTFIALNCRFMEKINNIDVKKEKVIIGQILEVKRNKMLFKWQYDTESIPQAYSGVQIPANISLSKTLNKNADVYIGLVDLERTPIIGTKQFIMVYKINKENASLRSNKFEPFRHISARKKNAPMSVLCHIDDEGVVTPVINTDYSSINKNMLSKDAVIPDIDQIFSELEDKLDKQ